MGNVGLSFSIKKLLPIYTYHASIAMRVMSLKLLISNLSLFEGLLLLTDSKLQKLARELCDKKYYKEALPYFTRAIVSNEVYKSLISVMKSFSHFYCYLTLREPEKIMYHNLFSYNDHLIFFRIKILLYPCIIFSEGNAM